MLKANAWIKENLIIFLGNIDDMIIINVLFTAVMGFLVKV
jgi:uncharacterized membrane protein YkvA (DUF1232 family)